MPNRILRRALSLCSLALILAFVAPPQSYADGTSTSTSGTTTVSPSTKPPSDPNTGEPDTGNGAPQPKPAPSTITTSSAVGTTSVIDPVLLALLALLHLLVP
jgi:hypothetical protein